MSKGKGLFLEEEDLISAMECGEFISLQDKSTGAAGEKNWLGTLLIERSRLSSSPLIKMR